MNNPVKRNAQLSRKTKETDISLNLTLDGSSQVSVQTGFGLADHMLTLMAFWAGFDLQLSCQGDLEIDAHHTLEDVGLSLGKAISQALGDRKGIARVGAARVPMDEALADVCIDFSGRSWLVFNGQDLLPPVMGGQERDLWRENFKSLAAGAAMNLHISMLYGQNGHHLLESACKGLGLALSQAVSLKHNIIMSTKGSIEV